MSISLAIEGRLWGLIACRHRAPMRATLACRAMVQLLGRLDGLAIARIERQALAPDIDALLLAPTGVDPLVDGGASPAACAAVGRLFGLAGVALSPRWSDWLLLFHDEVPRLDVWAAVPANAVSRTGGRLLPRGSFAAWREAVLGHCKPCAQADLERATAVFGGVPA